MEPGRRGQRRAPFRGHDAALRFGAQRSPGAAQHPTPHSPPPVPGAPGRGLESGSASAWETRSRGRRPGSRRSSPRPDGPRGPVRRCRRHEEAERSGSGGSGSASPRPPLRPAGDGKAQADPWRGASPPGSRAGSGQKRPPRARPREPLSLPRHRGGRVKAPRTPGRSPTWSRESRGCGGGGGGGGGCSGGGSRHNRRLQLTGNLGRRSRARGRPGAAGTPRPACAGRRTPAAPGAAGAEAGPRGPGGGWERGARWQVRGDRLEGHRLRFPAFSRQGQRARLDCPPWEEGIRRLKDPGTGWVESLTLLPFFLLIALH